MNILDTIIAAKRKRLAAATDGLNLAAYRNEAMAARAKRPAHRLSAALVPASRPAIIAEIKRRSPSKGELRPGLDPAEIALAYELNGSAAISVLTEEDHFGGSLDDLRKVRTVTELPVLRKDLIVDEFQVYEAALAGADALLLIVAALDDETLRGLSELTEQLGLDALVEVHTAEEFHRAVAVGATLIGVNNRNLQTFEVSLEVSLELAKLADPHQMLVTESGIATAEDIRRLHGAGYRGFLIGESFMKTDDPGAAVRELNSAITVER